MGRKHGAFAFPLICPSASHLRFVSTLTRHKGVIKERVTAGETKEKVLLPLTTSVDACRCGTSTSLHFEGIKTRMMEHIDHHQVNIALLYINNHYCYCHHSLKHVIARYSSV